MYISTSAGSVGGGPPKNNFGPQFVSKNRGARAPQASPLDPPLSMYLSKHDLHIHDSISEK